jgi:putative drug exporter of the RND superfamily
MFERYGTFVARRARLVLVISGLLVLLAAGIGAGAFGKLQNGGFEDPASDSSRAAAVVDRDYGGATNLVLLVDARSGGVDDPAVTAAGTDLANRLAAEPGVTNVVSYWGTHAPSLRAHDGTRALIAAHLDGDEGQAMEKAKALIPVYTAGTPQFTVLAGGDAAQNRDVNGAVARSLAIAESIAVPLTMILLILAFESLVAALLPLVIGAIAIFGTFAELSILGSLTDVSVFAVNLTTALGLGLGIDYALLMVSRYREELAHGADPAHAVARTVATAGRTIGFAALTVAAALAAMLVFPLYFLRSFAYAGIGVVLVAALAALVVAPALLAVLGPRVNAGRLPWARRRPMRGPESALWGRLAGAVFRRPALAAVPVLAALLLAASPLRHVSFGTPDAGALPSGAASRTVAEAIQRDLPGNDVSAVDVVLDSPVPAGALSGYAARLSTVDKVAAVQSSAGVFTHGQRSADGDPTLARSGAQRLTVVTGLVPKSGSAQTLVGDLRAVPGPDGVHPLVGGEDAQFVDTRHAIAVGLPWAVLMIVLTSMVVLFLFTGSLVQPIRALLLGALSLSATIGVMTWIFQDGHLSGLLGFTPRPVDLSMTVLLFCIAFGLSMDYEVFLTSRIKELHDAGAGVADATVTGLARTGRLVSTAAGLLAVSFLAFGTSNVSFLQMFGIGTALAIIIDATLVRGVLVPVVMRLVGTRIWYAPPPLRRVYRRVALQEA